MRGGGKWRGREEEMVFRSDMGREERREGRESEGGRILKGRD